MGSRVKRFHVEKDAIDGSVHIQDETVSISKLSKSFGTETTQSVGAGAQVTISKGIYYVTCGANTAVEYSPDGGSTWRTLISAGGAGLVVSDGSNVRLNNGGGAAEDSYLLPLS